VIGTLERHEYDFGLISQIVKTYRSSSTDYLTADAGKKMIRNLLTEIERIVKAYG